MTQDYEYEIDDPSGYTYMVVVSAEYIAPEAGTRYEPPEYGGWDLLELKHIYCTTHWGACEIDHPLAELETYLISEVESKLAAEDAPENYDEVMG